MEESPVMEVAATMPEESGIKELERFQDIVDDLLALVPEPPDLALKIIQKQLERYQEMAHCRQKPIPDLSAEGKAALEAACSMIEGETDLQHLKRFIETARVTLVPLMKEAGMPQYAKGVELGYHDVIRLIEKVERLHGGSKDESTGSSQPVESSPPV